MPVLNRRALALVALLGSPLAITPALAHAELRASEPAEGAVLRTSPPTLRLSFTEPVRVTTLRLLDGAGRETAIRRDSERAAQVERVSITPGAPLAPGGYRIEWRGMSDDGHAGTGTIRFQVEPAR